MDTRSDGIERVTRASAGWKVVTATAVVAALALLAAGCGGGDSASDTTQPPGTFKANEVATDVGPPQSGGTLSFGLNAETDGWDPTSNRWASSGYIVGYSIFDPLAVFGDDLKAHPYLAKSFTSNADFTEWVIGVREGVTFHDGTPVDAAAIQAGLVKQKTAYEIGVRLVGSEMCIRDRCRSSPTRPVRGPRSSWRSTWPSRPSTTPSPARPWPTRRM